MLLPIIRLSDLFDLGLWSDFKRLSTRVLSEKQRKIKENKNTDSCTIHRNNTTSISNASEDRFRQVNTIIKEGCERDWVAFYPLTTHTRIRVQIPSPVEKLSKHAAETGDPHG